MTLVIHILFKCLFSSASGEQLVLARALPLVQCVSGIAGPTRELLHQG